MRKILKLIIISIVLSSCGYNPILVNKETDLSIKEFISIGDEKISKKIISNLKALEKNDGDFIVTIKPIYKTDIASKDKKGNPATYVTTLNVEFTIEGNDIKKSSNFRESTTYNNQSSKFKLKQNEDKLRLNMINKISEDIMIFVLSLK